MRVTFPLKLPSASNLREHWAKKARRVKAQRFATQVALHGKAVLPDIREWREHLLWKHPLHLEVTLTRVAPRMLDGDNLQAAFKAVRDEIADALGVDDGDARVRWLYGQRKGLVKEYAVEVEILEEQPAVQGFDADDHARPGSGG